MNHTDFGSCFGGPFLDFTGNMGIVGTPVIDRATYTMYFVARTKENGTRTLTCFSPGLSTTMRKNLGFFFSALDFSPGVSPA